MFNMFTVQVKLWMDVSVCVCDCSFSSIFRKNVFVFLQDKSEYSTQNGMKLPNEGFQNSSA